MRSILFTALVLAVLGAGAFPEPTDASPLSLPMPRAQDGPVADPRMPPAASDTASPDPAIGVPLDSGALDAMRGGDGSTTNTVDVAGRVDGNSADGVVSGANTIQGGAFGGSAGISTVIQNSGSNVLIQNGMVVNVQFVDPTP